MVTTNNAEWAARMRTMSLHGLSRDAWARYTADGSWAYEIVAPGFKYNLTDIAAALGIAQLQKCERLWKMRERYAALYNEGFADLLEIVRPVVADDVQHAWHLYVIQLDLERLRVTRSQFIELLKKEHIGCSVHFIPIHLHPYYRKTLGYQPDDCPVANAVFQRIVSLPLYSRMTEQDVERVIVAVRDLVKAYRR
jgi:perosamine synthetase